MLVEPSLDVTRPQVATWLNLTGLSPSTTYFIQIHRRGGGGGATISGNICVYEPVTPPAVIEDCNGGTTVCASTSFTGNSSGSGNISDLNAGNQGCLNSGEHESSWYYFSAATAGDFAFTIVTSVDYDFAVWGPYASASCPPNEAPLRCSYSGTTGNTGLLDGSGDNTEGSGGNRFVEDINANAGDVFIICIDNYSSDASGFDLNWSLSNGASLDCTSLPVEMANFKILQKSNSNLIQWETKSESESREFIIEKSLDGNEFEKIGSREAAGNSSATINYEFEDFEWQNSVTYYRLKMVDIDGTFEYSHIPSVKRTFDDVIIYPNPTNSDLNFDFGNSFSGNFQIIFTNMLGERVMDSGSVNQTNSVFQTSILERMSDGLYFVEITDEYGNHVGSYKIVKNNE